MSTKIAHTVSKPCLLHSSDTMPPHCVSKPVTCCAGLPQQTAICLGAGFSGLASLLFFLPLHDRSIAGAVVLAMLLAASMLYGVFNYCAACTMFGLGIWLGIVPKTAHTAAINVKVSRAALYFTPIELA